MPCDHFQTRYTWFLTGIDQFRPEHWSIRGTCTCGEAPALHPDLAWMLRYTTRPWPWQERTLIAQVSYQRKG